MSDEKKKSSNPPKKKRFVKLSTYIISIIIVLGVGIVGTLGVQFFIQYQAVNDAIQEQQTQDSSSENLSLGSITELHTVLTSQYYGDISSSELIKGAMQGMTETVEDPYTEYLDNQESNAVNEDIQGSFEGIGAEVMKDGETVRIVSPIPGSPAEAAGLQPNDRITAVDGQSVADLSINEAVSLIRGPKGSSVELTVLRGQEEFTVQINRDSIPVQSVFHSIHPEKANTAHVQITNFNQQTYQELVDALKTLDEQGVTQYIFDVRGNPGGVLNSALKISNIFVEDGDPLMHSKQEENGERTTYTASSEKYGDYKFQHEGVLLINGGSASASEILAGAMKESGYPIIGSTSYGKGTVQSIYPLTNAGDVKFTNGIWLTASGEWINEKGIQPDISVDMPEYADLLLINSEKTYSKGDQSAEVQNINSILNSLGYSVPDSQSYTQETVNAVESFQSEHEIEATGEITGETATTLISEVQKLIEENDKQLEAAVDYFQNQ